MRVALYDTVERGGLERGHVSPQACYVRNFQDTVAPYEPGKRPDGCYDPRG